MNLASLLSGPLPARAAAVAGAIGGAAAITALYLVRLRRRRVVVSFAPLWLDAVGPRRTDQLGAPAARSAVAAAGAGAARRCVLLAAVDPRPAAADRAGRSLVVLIDRSASMSARDGAGDAARRRPRARAHAIVDGLAAADRALVASFAVRRRRRERLRGRRRGRLRARGRRASRPARSPGDLPRALDVRGGDPARPPAPDGRAGQRRRVQRRRPPRTIPADVDVRFAGVGLASGRRGGNVGIISFAARRVPADPAAVEAALVVQNFGGTPAAVARRHRGRRRHRRARAPGPGAPASAGGTSCPTCSRADARLQARLLTADGRPLAQGGADDLALDDTAFAVVPPLPRRRVLRVGGADLYLDGALLSLGRTVTVDRADAGGRRGAARALARLRPRHLRRRHARGAARPTGRFLYLDPHGPGSPFAERGTRARSGDRRRAPRPPARAPARSRPTSTSPRRAGWRWRPATSRSPARSACRC